MKVNGQTKIYIDYLSDGKVMVYVWHGVYARENKPENFKLVQVFEGLAKNFEGIQICQFT